MSWTGPADFFAMVGYATYVWGAYGMTALCLVLDPLAAGRRHRKALADAERERDDGAWS